MEPAAAGACAVWALALRTLLPPGSSRARARQRPWPRASPASAAVGQLLALHRRLAHGQADAVGPGRTGRVLDPAAHRAIRLALAHLAPGRLAAQDAVDRLRHIMMHADDVALFLLDEDIEGGGRLALQDRLLRPPPPP